MKTKIISSLILLVISTFVFVASCSKSEDEEFSAGTSATSSASTVSATIEVYDGETESARSLSRSAFSIAGNTFSEISSMTASVKEGVSTHIDNQSLSKDASDGRWKTTLLNLPTGVTLTFSGDAYYGMGVDNTTKTFSGTASTALSTSGTNIIALTMYPVSNNTTQTFPIISSILRPSTMNAAGTATVQVSVKGSTDETLNYRFITSGNGTFNPGGCDTSSGCDNSTYAGVDFPLSGTTGTIVSTFTAPTVIPSSGKVNHTVRVTNSQNNAVEVDFSITLTNGSSGSGTYSLEPRFAPVITGLTGRRGYPGSSDNSSDNGSLPDYLTWDADVSLTGNSGQSGTSYSWSMPGVTFCQYYSWNPGYCYANPSTSAKMTPYNPDNTTGTLTFEVGQNFTDGDNITTRIFYQIPLGMFPDNVTQ
jgi:hypothetical protein